MQQINREQLTTILQRREINPTYWPAFRHLSEGRKVADPQFNLRLKTVKNYQDAAHDIRSLRGQRKLLQPLPQVPEDGSAPLSNLYDTSH